MCLVCIINAEQSKQSSSASSGSSIEAWNSEADSKQLFETINNAVHYFAIGSMTNRVALSLRDLVPISSKPAKLKNYRLLFRGSGGMATVSQIDEYKNILNNNDSNDSNETLNDSVDYPFDCVHGVLHLLSSQHMKLLDEFEGGYNRKLRSIELLDGSKVEAYVYEMDKSKWKINQQHNLPTERYTDIIAQGCISHGVNIEWINFIKKHKCIERKNPIDFSHFTLSTATVPIISWEEIRKHNGMKGEKLWIVINNKVLSFCGDVNSFFPFGYFVKHQIGGTDYTLRFALGFYEPKYRMLKDMTSPSELEVEHRAWIEDQFANPPPVLSSSKWEFVGVVNNEPVRSYGFRKSKTIQSQFILDFTDDMNAGFYQFFVSGTTSGKWIIPDGIYSGQTLHIRKTATTVFEQDILIFINCQTLESPNVQNNLFLFPIHNYSMAWCWDGNCWFLEFCN